MSYTLIPETTNKYHLSMIPADSCQKFNPNRMLQHHYPYSITFYMEF